MTPPLVSVLMPTAGFRGEYMRQAWLSAMAQDYPNFEVIQEHDEGRGECYAINKAFARSSGSLITVLEDDDLMLPGKIKTLFLALTATDEFGAVFSLPKYIDANGHDLPVNDKFATWAKDHPVASMASIAFNQTGFRVFGGGCLYRREWWEKAGPWDESLWAAEEWEYHLRLLSVGCVFKAVYATLSAYRIHPAQKSARCRRRTLQRRLLLDRIDRKYKPMFEKIRNDELIARVAQLDRD